jgi:DNA-binding Lrp family transcriptional regulator
VHAVKKRYDAFIAAGGLPEDFSSARKSHKRRSEALDDDIVATLQNLVDEDPGRSMRSLARELGISEKTVRKKMTEDIRYKSYALRKGQFMSEGTKERRLEKAKMLLNRLKKPSSNGQLVFFSDEKNFSQDQKVNKKNNRWLCADIREVPVVMSTKFPTTVMVLGVVSNEDDVMPPHFFPRGLKINTEEYIRVLREVVKPWMDGIANGRHYVFQQDGAPAHTSKATQDWCRENLPDFWSKEVWPPCSPDCNPLDYFVWSICERDVNKVPHSTAASLMAKISEVMANLPRHTVAKSCRRFRGRIEAVVEAGGDFFE